MKKKFSWIIGIIIFIVIIFIGLQIFSNVYFSGGKLTTVPDIKGLGVSEAKALLEKNSLSLKIEGEGPSDLPPGSIFQQAPGAGRQVKAGRLIRGFVSSGKTAKIVPPLYSVDLNSAKVLLQKNGIDIKSIVYIKHSLPPKTVISSDPMTGEDVSKKNHVTLLVSKGISDSSVSMPDLIGFDLNQAKEKARNAGLIIGNIEYVTEEGFEKDIVLDTEPSAGESLETGAIIKLKVNKIQ